MIIMEVQELFDKKLSHVLRVIDSCLTPAQLAAVKFWAEKILMETAGQICRGGTSREKDFVRAYKYRVIEQVQKRCDDREDEITDPGFRTMTREIPLRVGVCRLCSGTGLLPGKERGQTCPDCSGSGRVKVRCTVITKVRPFIPE